MTRISPTIALATFAVWTAQPLLAAEDCLQHHYTSDSLDLGTATQDIASGDLDQDGDLDVLIADASGLWIFRNDGPRGFVKEKLAVGSSPAAVAVADIDSDGDADVVVGLQGVLGPFGTGYAKDGVRVLTNDGSGALAQGPLIPFAGTDSDPVGLFLRDVDADGNLDVVVGLGYHPTGALTASGGLWILLGDGAGSFAALPTHSLPATAKDVCVADFNGDGQLDVAEVGGYVHLAYGLGDGSFVNDPLHYIAGSYSGTLTSGDWDGDGDADLVTGNKYWVAPLINDGTGVFTPGQSLSVGYYVKGVTAGDLDGDGDLDLLATSGSSSAMRLLTNDGSGKFAMTTSLPAGTQSYAVHLADVNGDGLDDPWSGDVTSGLVTWGLSQCTVARYGTAKLSSVGCLPTMNALGTPSITGTGFTALAENELIDQPAVIVAGTQATELPMLGGDLLVQAPWTFIHTFASHGSGDPFLCDGVVTLPIQPHQLGKLGVGSQLFLQVLSFDPFQPDGTFVAISDALRFEVRP